MNKYLIFFVFTAIFIFHACDKHEDNDLSTNAGINKWIWEEMDAWYLWNELIPEYTQNDEDPDNYFYSLLYNKKDHWSFIVDDYQALINSFNGIETAMGYSLALYYKDASQYDVVGYVEFVYPNTPADRGGIKRGDIFSKVNGQTITANNYIELLYNTQQQTISFVEQTEDGYSALNETISLTAELLEENPVIKDSVYTMANKKIAYLTYVGFISNYNDALSDVMSRFKDENITDLIIDLRYNPGGDLNAANHLCSSIAPGSAVSTGSRLVNFNWNSSIQELLLAEKAYDNLYINMNPSIPVNLNLNKVYFLTTRNSASASELTITGLEPYLEVVTIGDTTHGKYTASLTFPDENNEWALQPIVIKYSNANGLTDFENGISPDYYVKDNYQYPLGDTNDPTLAKALDLILGTSTKSTTMQNDIPLNYYKSGGRHPILQNGLLHISNPF